MDILVTLNVHYIKQLAVMLTSLTCTHPDQNFTIYVAHSSMTNEDFNYLKSLLPNRQCHILSVQIEDVFLEDAPITNRYPKEMYYRIFAAKYLPQSLERVLYLDPDLVVIGDLHALYHIDFRDNLFAAATHVKEIVRKFNELRLNMPKKSTYINSGVMMMNLDKLRQEQDTKEVLEYIQKYKKMLFLPDQDIISSLYGDKIIPIDSIKYNLSDRTYLVNNLGFDNEQKIDIPWVEKNVSIIHYCGKNKPWREDYQGNLGAFYYKYEKMLCQTEPEPKTDKKKLLFMLNPYAGKGEIKNKLLDIIDIFMKNNYEVTVHITQRQFEIPEVIKKQANKYDLLVSCGGDGTLNETVSGILDAKINIPLGYIPAGTVNDFASSLNIPKNMLNAARVIGKGKQFECDIGSFNNRYFTYVAAFGAFTDVAYQTSQDFKNLLGKAAYLLQGITRLPFLKTYKLQMIYGDKKIEDEFIFGMISNSLSVAGIRIDGKIDVSLNDGMLEVLLVKKPKNTLELQFMLNALLQQQLNKEYFYTFHTNQLSFDAEEEIPWTLDGEFGGAVKNGEICVNKQALRIIISQDIT